MRFARCNLATPILTITMAVTLDSHAVGCFEQTPTLPWDWSGSRGQDKNLCPTVAFFIVKMSWSSHETLSNQMTIVLDVILLRSCKKLNSLICVYGETNVGWRKPQREGHYLWSIIVKNCGVLYAELSSWCSLPPFLIQFGFFLNYTLKRLSRKLLFFLSIF